MRSSRNYLDLDVKDGSCCNRLENGVKPQLDGSELTSKSGCNRLENAVKPQLFRFAFARALLL